MRRVSLIILPILLLISCSTAPQQTSQSPARPTNTPIKVTATDLTRRYEENVVAADYTYTQKLVTVSGTVTGIERFVDTFHVHLSAADDSYRWGYVTCVFPNEQFGGVLDLRKGGPLPSPGPVKVGYGAG